MILSRSAFLPLALLSLAACQSDAERQADVQEDRIEAQADRGAAAAGETIAALGLTERQLLDADLLASNGTEIGDIEQVRRDDAGKVSALLVEIEDSDPDRFVEIPVTGLSVVRTRSSSDADLKSQMTAQDLAALPDAAMSAR